MPPAPLAGTVTAQAFLIDPGAALGLYRRASEIDPEFGEPLVNAAELYLSGGNAEAASAMIEEALRRRPDHPEYLSVRSAIHLRTGDREAARADALRALEVDRNSVAGFEALGTFYKEAGEFGRADSVYAEALERHPDSAPLKAAREEAAVAARKAARGN